MSQYQNVWGDQKDWKQKLKSLEATKSKEE